MNAHKCAGNIAGDVTTDHVVKGGSTPTPALFFHLGMHKEANELVKKYHYSHRPVNCIICGSFHEAGGLFGTAGKIVAACIFSIPPTRWSESVLELLRLVRHEEYSVPLSQLISWTVKEIRKRKQYNLLVSFADSGQGHHGGIYQASAWNYSGKRKPTMDGVMFHNEFIPGRTANALWGTRSPDRLSDKGIQVEPHYDSGKYLYWKYLNRRGKHKAKNLGLHKLDYPKTRKVL